MKIHKNGFVAEIAYEGNAPQTTSLCALFWRFWFGIVRFVFMLVAVAICFILGFFAGQRPTVFESDPHGLETNAFTPYSKWPKFRGHHVWPIVPLAVVLFVWLFVPRITPTQVAVAVKNFSWISVFHVLFLFVVLLAAFALIILSVIALNKVRRTETWSLIKKWFKAKKQKVCPLVEIVSD